MTPSTPSSTNSGNRYTTVRPPNWPGAGRRDSSRSISAKMPIVDEGDSGETMKIFCTGASGYIGGSVAAHLIAAGHQVTGLVRSPEKAEAVRARGIQPVLGTLDDGEILAQAARAADVVVNAASADHKGAVVELLDALPEAVSRSSTHRDRASSARAPRASGRMRSSTRTHRSRHRRARGAGRA